MQTLKKISPDTELYNNTPFGIQNRGSLPPCYTRHIWTEYWLLLWAGLKFAYNDVVEPFYLQREVWCFVLPKHLFVFLGYVGQGVADLLNLAYFVGSF